MGFCLFEGDFPVFCTSTTVGKLCFKGEEIVIHHNLSGPVSRHLYNELTGIQYGTREDRFGWVKPLD